MKTFIEIEGPEYYEKDRNLCSDDIIKMIISLDKIVYFIPVEIIAPHKIIKSIIVLDGGIELYSYNTFDEIISLINSNEN